MGADFMTHKTRLLLVVACSALVCLTACSTFLPSQGATRSDVANTDRHFASNGIQVIGVTNDITRQLLARQDHFQFASLGAQPLANDQTLGPGDQLDITIWETPPAALFAQPTSSGDSLSLQSNGPNHFPQQQISKEGTISLPFAGVVKVAGLTQQEAEKRIRDILKGRANDPQVMVRRVVNTSSTVTVVGEVNKSSIVPLTPKGERLLDVLAKSEGVKQSVDKLTVQLTRNDYVYSMPLDVVIRDNRQNIPVKANDVITVLYQPLSFSVLGATGKNAEISYEASGISLAQALARSGGVRDERADPQGVFIFRYEAPDALAWPHQPVQVTSESKVPVIYKFDMRDPATFFTAQSFPINNKDLIYVSDAPSVQFQKFLSLVSTVVSPTMTTTVQMRAITAE